MRPASLRAVLPDAFPEALPVELVPPARLPREQPVQEQKSWVVQAAQPLWLRLDGPALLREPAPPERPVAELLAQRQREEPSPPGPELQRAAPSPVARRQPAEQERPQGANAPPWRRLPWLPCLFRLEPPRLLRLRPNRENACELFRQPTDQSSWSASSFR